MDMRKEGEYYEGSESTTCQNIQFGVMNNDNVLAILDGTFDFGLERSEDGLIVQFKSPKIRQQEFRSDQDHFFYEFKDVQIFYLALQVRSNL